MVLNSSQLLVVQTYLVELAKRFLEIVDEEKLQSNAKIVGDFLLAGFRELKKSLNLLVMFVGWVCLLG